MESHILKIISLFIGLIGTLTLAAQTIPPGGEDIIRQQGMAKINYSKADLGSVTVVSNEQDTTTLSVKTLQQPAFIYNLSVNIPLKKQRLAEGQVLLLSFQAKTESSSLETGEAKGLWIMRQSDSHKDNLERAVSFASEWRTYYYPLQTTQSVSADDLSLVLQFGYPPQEVLLRDLKFQVFPKGTALNSLPKTLITYAGQAPDAPWRKAAVERIETLRKGDFTLHFVDKKGRPLKGVPIQLQLKKHQFSWGAAVNAKTLINQPEHLDHFSELFNLAVFENDLKIKAWNKNDNQAELVTNAMQLLEEKQIEVKGHVLIWPGFKYLPANFRDLEDNPEKVTKLIDRHLNDILSATKGRISRWDVVNEAYTNKDLQRITGSEEILFEGFRTLAKKEPTVLRYTNEYGIISKGGHDQKKQQWYYDFIKRIDQNTGGLVDGIGIQCHIGTDLTPPERVLEILDFYGELGKKIAISEFTMEVTDPDIRQQYTHDFMLAAFSHSSVHEFLFWGYYGPTHEKAAIFDDQWRLAPMGQAFHDLVKKQWTTSLIETTNDQGEIAGRGFYGTYEYTFVQGNQVVKGTFNHTSENSGTINIEIQ